MSTLSNDGGPNVASIVEREVRHRLERHSRVRPERLDDIMRYARENVSVRMTRTGWNVVEADIQRLFAEIENRAGWLTDDAAPGARESATDRLKRANREATQRQLRDNGDGSFTLD